MIRKLILGFCFLLAMFPASAFSLEGLSVENRWWYLLMGSRCAGLHIVVLSLTCMVAVIGWRYMPPVVETALKERTYCLMSVFIVRVGR